MKRYMMAVLFPVLAACSSTPSSPTAEMPAAPTATVSSGSGSTSSGGTTTGGTGEVARCSGDVDVHVRRIASVEGLEVTLELKAEARAAGALYARVYYGERGGPHLGDFPLVSLVLTSVKVRLPNYGPFTLTVDVELKRPDGTIAQCDGSVSGEATEPPPTTTVPPTSPPPQPKMNCSVDKASGQVGDSFTATLADEKPGDGPYAVAVTRGNPGSGTVAASGGSFASKATAAPDVMFVFTSKSARTATCKAAVKEVPPQTEPPQCSGPSSLKIGETGTFSVSKGTAPYSWSAPGGTPNAAVGVGSITTFFSQSGEKKVTVTDAEARESTCRVQVAPRPTTCEEVALRVEDGSQNGKLKLDIAVGKSSSKRIEVSAVAENGSQTISGTVPETGGTFEKAAPAPPRWYRVTVTAYDGDGRACVKTLRICF